MMIHSMKIVKTSVRMLFVLTLLVGVIYPLFITAVASLIFPQAAEGSLVRKNGVIVGSTLLGQRFASKKYFYGRPSSTDYSTMPSGASNLSLASKNLTDLIEARRSTYGSDAPFDVLTASASGLDPHLSIEGVMYQLDRVAAARGLRPEQTATLRQIIIGYEERPQLRFLGKPRVNILELNLKLNELFP
jgi:K+-transporting ATPase ATPase C chain